MECLQRFRQAWPDVRVIFRGDSGFCRHRMLNWCERHGVDYIVGIAKNEALLRHIVEPMSIVQQLYELTCQKQREFFRFYYAAGTWTKRRQVIAKLEITAKGQNPRFIVSAPSPPPTAR